MLSDLEAIKAIDRLCAVSRNLDHIGLREWIAAHCGLNPYAAKPLDPDPAIVADRDTLRATVAALRDGLERTKALLAASETRGAELAAELATVRKSGKSPRNAALSPGNADSTKQIARATKGKPERNAYQRELMRKRRAESRAKTAPADTV